MKLVLGTDGYGYETSWNITDLDNEILYESSTTYANYQLYIEEFCLGPTSCYIFNIMDNFGDGITVPGYYEIYYNDNLIHSGDGDFDSSEMTILPCTLN